MGTEARVGVQGMITDVGLLICAPFPPHAQLFIEKAEAEDRWFQRLVALRQERLMGSPVA